MMESELLKALDPSIFGDDDEKTVDSSKDLDSSIFDGLQEDSSFSFDPEDFFNEPVEEKKEEKKPGLLKPVSIEKVNIEIPKDSLDEKIESLKEMIKKYEELKAEEATLRERLEKIASEKEEISEVVNRIK